MRMMVNILNFLLFIINYAFFIFIFGFLFFKVILIVYFFFFHLHTKVEAPSHPFTFLVWLSAFFYTSPSSSSPTLLLLLHFSVLLHFTSFILRYLFQKFFLYWEAFGFREWKIEKMNNGYAYVFCCSHKFTIYQPF